MNGGMGQRAGRRQRLVSVVLALFAAIAVLRAAPPDLSSLGQPEIIAPGVELYRLSDQALLSPPGVVAVQLLRLNPGRVDLRLVFAQDTVLGLETVPDMARRSEATAAINATERHPRTVIGTSGDGRIWLIAVDGRDKALSLGMSFAELQNLVTRVGLVDALNLDGGGSTTMVVRGVVVNHPSDATGPRKVSDAIVVRAR